MSLTVRYRARRSGYGTNISPECGPPWELGLVTPSRRQRPDGLGKIRLSDLASVITVNHLHSSQSLATMTQDDCDLIAPAFVPSTPQGPRLMESFSMSFTYLYSIRCPYDLIKAGNIASASTAEDHPFLTDEAPYPTTPLYRYKVLADEANGNVEIST